MWPDRWKLRNENRCGPIHIHNKNDHLQYHMTQHLLCYDTTPRKTDRFEFVGPMEIDVESPIWANQIKINKKTDENNNKQHIWGWFMGPSTGTKPWLHAGLLAVDLPLACLFFLFLSRSLFPTLPRNAHGLIRIFTFLKPEYSRFASILFQNLTSL